MKTIAGKSVLAFMLFISLSANLSCQQKVEDKSDKSHIISEAQLEELMKNRPASNNTSLTNMVLFIGLVQMMMNLTTALSPLRKLKSQAKGC